MKEWMKLNVASLKIAVKKFIETDQKGTIAQAISVRNGQGL